MHTQNHDKISSLVILTNLFQIDITMHRSFIEDKVLSDKIFADPWLLLTLSSDCCVQVTPNDDIVLSDKVFSESWLLLTFSSGCCM